MSEKIEHLEHLEHLIIIGNGFDLEHELDTKFSDFGKYCIKKGIKLFYSDEDYNDEDNLKKIKLEYWSDFEFNFLGNFKNGVTHPSIYNKDARENNTSKEQEDKALELVDELLNNWIRIIKKDIKDRKNKSNPVFTEWLNKKNKFIIDFNYTNILETWYNIPLEEKIQIHISNDKYIIGVSPNRTVYPDETFHGIIQNKEKDEKSYGNLKNTFSFCDNKKISEMKGPFEGHFKSKQLNEETLKKLKILFETKINRNTKIHFYGFSFGETDGYFLRFLLSNEINIENIKIYFLDSEDKKNKTKIIDEFIQKNNELFKDYYFREKNNSKELENYYSNIDTIFNKWFFKTIVLLKKNNELMEYSKSKHYKPALILEIIVKLALKVNININS